MPNTATPTVEKWARMHYDPNTGEMGAQVKVQVAEAVVKGSLLAVSSSADRKYIKQASEYDTCAIAYEASDADGYIWAWTTGAVCQMLVKDSTAITRGYVAISADTDGRMDNIDLSTIGGNPAITTHFKEVGHVLESKSAGTNVLVLIHFHTL